MSLSYWMPLSHDDHPPHQHLIPTLIFPPLALTFCWSPAPSPFLSVGLSVHLAVVPAFSPLLLPFFADVQSRHAVINHVAALCSSLTLQLRLPGLHGWVMDTVAYAGDVIVQIMKMMQLKGDWGASIIRADRKKELG